MFEFLRMQYRLGRLDAAGLAKYLAAGRLTAAQYRQIAGPQPGDEGEVAADG